MLGWQAVLIGGIISASYSVYLVFQDMPWFLSFLFGVGLIMLSFWLKDRFE